MSEWQKVKIGDFLTQYRITHLVQDDQYYGQITISKNNTIKFRENNIGKRIGRKRQFVIDLKKYPQTLIFTRQGVLDGSIGIAPKEIDGCIATENMPMFSVNYEIIHPELLLYLIKSEMFKQKVKTIMPTGSAQKAIHERELLELDFLLPKKLQHQQKLVDNLKRYDEIILPVLEEETLNFERIKKLRQAILQEAIEGKLTTDWRVNNSVCLGDSNTDAAALLATIKAEKKKLIAEGIIKATKKQESAVDNNLVSKIPETWAYEHLGDISLQITDGTHQTPTYTNDGRMFISAQNIKPFKFMPENHKFVSESAYQEYTKNTKAEKNDLLIGRVGAGIGETAVIDKEIEFAIYVSLGLIKPFKKLINSNFLCIVFNSPYGVNYAKGNISSGGGSAGNFNLGRIRSFPIPLPPLAEQEAIVKRVDSLLNYVNTLEQQVTERKNYAKQLMQAVLKEAFAGKFIT